MINIVEKVIIPYNKTTSKLRIKDKYYLYAPVADINKIGMAGFNSEDFVVNKHIVSISPNFTAKIEARNLEQDAINTNRFNELVIKNTAQDERLDNIEADIIELDERTNKIIADFTVNPETGVGTKYYTDGTTSLVHYPVGTGGGTSPSPSWLQILTFNPEHFVEGELGFSALQTGQTNNEYIVAIDRLDEQSGEFTGYRQTANSAFKGSDGSLLISGINEPFAGRILLVGTSGVSKEDIGLGNVDNVKQLPYSALDDDETMSANSAVRVATQRAIKAWGYSREQINFMLGGNGIAITIVDELPTEDILPYVIYFKPVTEPKNENYYEEYIYLDNQWELLGTTKVDLSNYYTKDETDDKFFIRNLDMPNYLNQPSFEEYEEIKNKYKQQTDSILQLGTMINEDTFEKEGLIGGTLITGSIYKSFQIADWGNMIYNPDEFDVLYNPYESPSFVVHRKVSHAQVSFYPYVMIDTQGCPIFLDIQKHYTSEAEGRLTAYTYSSDTNDYTREANFATTGGTMQLVTFSRNSTKLKLVVKDSNNSADTCYFRLSSINAFIGFPDATSDLVKRLYLGKYITDLDLYEHLNLIREFKVENDTLMYRLKNNDNWYSAIPAVDYNNIMNQPIINVPQDEYGDVQDLPYDVPIGSLALRDEGNDKTLYQFRGREHHTDFTAIAQNVPVFDKSNIANGWALTSVDYYDTLGDVPSGLRLGKVINVGGTLYIQGDSSLDIFEYLAPSELEFPYRESTTNRINDLSLVADRNIKIKCKLVIGGDSIIAEVGLQYQYLIPEVLMWMPSGRGDRCYYEDTGELIDDMDILIIMAHNATIDPDKWISFWAAIMTEASLDVILANLPFSTDNTVDTIAVISPGVTDIVLLDIVAEEGWKRFALEGETAPTSGSSPANMTQISFASTDFTNGEITFTPAQTGLSSSLANVIIERQVSGGYASTANSVVKLSDGTVKITNINEPFNGRIIIINGGA